MRARVYVCVLVFHEIPFVVLGPSYPLDVVGCGGGAGGSGGAGGVGDALEEPRWLSL